ncbi:hypothetical protein MY1884_006048 [Beauveria asiatica]
MDGLLIDSEDIITESTNQLLDKYGRPPFTPSIRAQLMGVPDSINGDLFHSWAKLPISREQFAHELREQLRLDFPRSKPLPGAGELVSRLSLAQSATGNNIVLAIALQHQDSQLRVESIEPRSETGARLFPSR